MADPNFALQFSPNKVDAGKSGDVGYTVGSYTMTVTNEKDKKQKPAAQGSGKSEKKTEPSLSEQRLEPAKREP